jgi:hypothetical protein
MFDPNDPSILWVAASASGDKGDGSAEEPFGSIERALEVVRPGQTIVLKKGSYPGGVNFELSGTIHQPIRITADSGAEVEVEGACWFFYDSSDLIVSGITFRSAPFGALSVIGSCERNRFENLRFINCGTSTKTTCTFFFGGSGGSCNVVENCHFEHAAASPSKTVSIDTLSVGLMVSEGDADHGAPIKNHVYRRNRFVNYDYGVLIGANDDASGLYGHVVEYNTIENCAVEGILVKCGDTQVRGNLVIGCRNNSIDIAAGKGSMVEHNRVIDCGNGIRVNDADHTVVNNCVVRCGGEAVWAGGAVSASGTSRAAATNLFIENNTFVDCGAGPGTGDGKTGAPPVAGIRIDAGTTCIIRRNLVAGKNETPAMAGPFVNDAANASAAGCMIVDNIAADAVPEMTGVARAEVLFLRRDGNDYTNDSGYGAAGWMLKPEGFDPDIDDLTEAEKYCHVDIDGEDEDPVGPGEEAAEDFDVEAFMGNLFKPDLEQEEQ